MRDILSELKIHVTKELIQGVIKISKKAGSAIMEIYHTDFDVQIKDDSSPVTQADKNANTVIEIGLKNLDGTIPILSEEGKGSNYEERKSWKTFWLVDPLDGTKDFIKKNGEFTVNIALIENQSPIFGVVYAPAIDLLFWGSIKNGAWKKETHNPAQSISVSSQMQEITQIAASRSHPSAKMDSFLSQFKKYELQPMGSSLKICRVADGTVHLYPRLGPTMEWDTAAAHAVLKSAGGEMLQAASNAPLKYNKQNLLNPEFMAGNQNFLRGLEPFI